MCEAYANFEKSRNAGPSKTVLAEEDSEFIVNLYYNWTLKRGNRDTRKRQRSDEVDDAQQVMHDNPERSKLLEILDLMRKECNVDYNSSKIVVMCTHLVRPHL